MGLLIKGRWYDRWYNTEETGGSFVRADSQFRHWITPDGEPGPTGAGGFPAVSGRYHLYVSLACPWAHRTLIFRKLKSLEQHITVTVVDPHMLENGWAFTGERGSDREPLFGLRFLHQLYCRAQPEYSGRVTVPVLWDKMRNTIVNNESSEIIRMLNNAFHDVGAFGRDYYPQPLREEIDSINEFVYKNVNNGVYRCGFATRQQAYESAFVELFSALDTLDSRLANQRYLTGTSITEADWRLFTTLVRFDAVYYGHFKCNQQRIEDYPNLSHYLRDLYQHPGIGETVSMEHIKQHYYYSHKTINPTRIVPSGPRLDFSRRHNRDRFDHSAQHKWR